MELTPKTGIIYKIERLAVYDGPGIRTVIFLKGCPLRCLWCTSPESQKRRPETGWYEDKCTGCQSCIPACPAAAGMAGNDDGPVDITKEPCRGCGRECVAACPNGALKMIGREVTSDRVADMLEKDAVFYHRSQGGITLSGGDPLFQPGFSAAILENAVKMGFHTAVETSGHASWGNLLPILKHLDLIYVDVKHMNPKQHEALTGRSNKQILDNIRRIDKEFPQLELVLRFPAIPGLNDDRENLTRTAEFASGLSHMKRLEILPYHRYGVATYPVIGKSYGLDHVKPPTRGRIQTLERFIKEKGVNARIGG